MHVVLSESRFLNCICMFVGSCILCHKFGVINMSYLYKKPTKGDYVNTYRLNNDDDDSICRIIVEDSTFNGFPNSRAFND